MNKKLNFARFTLIEKEINPLPDDAIEEIKVCPIRKNGIFMKNYCHRNSIIAGKEFKYDGCENKIVEGVVLCEDGFLFEHYWNRVVSASDSSDYDVTLDIIASEGEKNTRKTYFEYKTYSILEMEMRNGFSIEMEDIISDYYAKNSVHKERYYHSNNEISTETFKERYSFNLYRKDIISKLEHFFNYVESIYEYVDVVVFGSFISEKEEPNDIDIIVFGYPNQNGFDSEFKSKFTLCSPDKRIHVKSQLTQTKKTAKEMVEDFNNQKKNKEEDISIKKYVTIKIKG